MVTTALPFAEGNLELINASWSRFLQRTEQVRCGPPWRRRTKTQTVNDGVIEESGTNPPPLKECAAYELLYKGRFPLLAVYVFLNQHPYLERCTYVAAHIQADGAESITIAADEQLSLEIDAQQVEPFVTFVYREVKEAGKPFTATLRATLTFRSREQAGEYLQSLQPDDTIMLAKLTKAG